VFVGLFTIFFLAKNNELYENKEKYMTIVDFSKWLKNEFTPNNAEYLWIKDVSSMSVKQSIINADKAYKKFCFCCGGNRKL
jgi:putative transposase